MYHAYERRNSLGRSMREKILVVQTSFLGDAVLTTPLLSAIRGRFPKAKLAVLCTPQARDLFAGNPDIDEILTDDKRGSGRGLSGAWRKAKDLKSRGFTIAVSPHKSFRSALLVYLAGIPYRIGFRQSPGWFFYHSRVVRDPTRHDVERNLALLQPLGVDPAESLRDLRVEVDPVTRAAVEQLFHSLGVERNGLIMGVNPGSVWPTKRWALEGYAELMTAGRLSLRAGRIRRLTPHAGHIDVELTAGALAADLVVNTTGPSLSLRAHSLLNTLLDRGLVTECPLGLGIAIDENGRCRTRDGRPSRLFTLGTLTRGQFFETVAVPHISRYAGDIARVIAG